MLARELWKRMETIHAITYFAPESVDAAKDAGLRGFWMGYFGFRAAPLGPIDAGGVEAIFANFEPAMISRAIPDAWSHADPKTLARRRSAAAGRALRRIAPEVEQVASRVNGDLESVILEGASIGRPLFSANRALAPLDDPVEQLWQNCSTLREHRGDGHVATLASAGLDGCEAHWLLIADQGLPAEVFFENRGWDDRQQAAAHTRLRERGLLDADGITPNGRDLRTDIETTTDRLAAAPFDSALSGTAQQTLIERLHPVSLAIAASGTLPFPNPMGLPRLEP